MRKIAHIFMCLVLLVLVPGCWNSKDIQNMAYVTALGIDYENGKFKSYAQVLNFTNVAKAENAELGKPVPVWVGIGEGRTVTESLTTMYSTSQLRVFWGHMKSVILTENTMQHGMDQIYEMLNRYREIRYNILMYGTKESLKKVLSQKSILNLSPLETIMDSPQQIYSQRSFILPVYVFKIIAQMDEPSGLAMIPSLEIEDNTWFEDQDSRPMFRINGAYFFQNKEYRGHLWEDDLKGTRWIQRQLQRSPINIPYEGKPVASLIMVKPHLYIKPVMDKGKPRFMIRVSINAYVDELVKDTPHKTMEKMASVVVENEIKMSYKKGLDQKADVFMLDENLYRKNPKKWHELHRTKPFILDKDSIKSIDVRVTIDSSGKYKQRVN
ncbi:Ger(x)C family spore germination protein [Paenibacillus sp. HJL G12]|uniref:Ger(X)C family spore germination protein n=1 Tax=Paenibacillus dendrobii TaxID=2691084 RepID=A0A7X3IFW3_9BACL|nr:Ger(x)C family spore germination protein [Paenibacillus dendrobii]MWV43173.1 Ger(x)C family spore germination protein [Paenibacillus dendrobii]